jgi:hypothetical protein
MKINRKTGTLAALTAAAALVAALLAGCGPTSKIAQPYDDASVSRHLTGPAEVVNMPDGFSNFADKCDGHGHRVYTAFHNNSAYAAIAVVTDASCPGGVPARPAK